MIRVPRWPVALPSVLLALALGAAPGCSSSSFRESVYRGDGLAFRVGAPPASWRHLEVTDARLAFRDEGAESTVLVNGRCGKDGDDVPLTALTAHLFFLFTDRETVEQKIVPLDGREAMHTVMRAKLDGVPKVYDVYVLKKDGCVYDFVGVWTPDKFDQNREAFERFVAGFHTLKEDS